MIAIVAAVVAAGAVVDGRRRGARQAATEQAVAQIEADRRAEELKPRFSIDDSPWPQIEGHYSAQIRSHCDRPLHVNTVHVLERPSLRSAVAGIVAPTTSSPVLHLTMDEALAPHDAFILDLVRRDGSYRTAGTGQLQLDVDEPGTDRAWPIFLTVELPASTAVADHGHAGA